MLPCSAGLLSEPTRLAEFTEKLFFGCTFWAKLGEKCMLNMMSCSPRLLGEPTQLAELTAKSLFGALYGPS